MSNIRKLALTFKSGIIYKTYGAGSMDDPFVQVKVGDVVKKTLAMINTTVPEWNETLIFENVKVKDAEGVWVTLWHSDATSNDVIGSVCISAISTQHLTVPIVDEKGVDQATLEIDVALDDDAADLEENGKVSANARPADSTTTSFSKYVDTYIVTPAEAEKERQEREKEERERAAGRGGGSKSPRSPRSGKGGGDDKKPSGSGSHSGVVYNASEGSSSSGSGARGSPASSSGSSGSDSGSGSPAGVVFGSSSTSSVPERRPYNASNTTSSTTTTTGPDGKTTTTTTYVSKSSSSYSSSSSTARERSPNKGSPTASSSTPKTSRSRSPAGGSSPTGGAGEEEGAPVTKEVVIGGSGGGGTPARRPYVAEELTPAYAEEVAVKEQKGSDTHMYHWLANDSLAFTAGEQQLTVFLDFPITKDIWRIETKFYHDEDHQGTTADFGVADSNVISKLYAKWLFNNSDTCAYYLDKTSAKITAGRTHKSLLSAFFGRSGTKFSVEIDMNERLLRFYSGNRLAPASVRIKPASLHVGFSGRFAQRFENVSVRRLERPTLRPQDKPEPLNWD